MKDKAISIVHRLQKAGYTAYFAGGCVRDHLLGQEAKDIDIATNATPEEVQRLFSRVTDEQGKCFGVVRVVDGDNFFEVATFRKEGDYLDGRRPDSVTFASPQEDAQRRDFTINGLFYNPLTDQLIDFVQGEADLHKGILRAIGEPEARFCEDKLRLLRAIRFASCLTTSSDSFFEIEESTWSALQKNAYDIRQVSPERIRDELNKIWTGPSPSRGLDLLNASGLLEKILPEIHRLHGVEQPPQWHPEGDVYQHVRLMLSHLKKASLPLALGVLFHDIGKKPTASVDPTGRIRFFQHEHVGADMTEKLMRRLRYSNHEISDVCQLVRWHMQFKDVMKMKLSKVKRLLARSTFPWELQLHRLDCLCSHGLLDNYHFLEKKQKELPEESIRPPRLLTGKDLLAMGLQPSKKIGEILATIEEAQLEGTLQTHEQAIKMAQTLISCTKEVEEEIKSQSK